MHDHKRQAYKRTGLFEATQNQIELSSPRTGVGKETNLFTCVVPDEPQGAHRRFGDIRLFYKGDMVL